MSQAVEAEFFVLFLEFAQTIGTVIAALQQKLQQWTVQQWPLQLEVQISEESVLAGEDLGPALLATQSTKIVY